MFLAFGRPALHAERVAEQVVQEAKEYMDRCVPVGFHLADQLLLPMVLAGAGEYVAMRPSTHTLVDIQAIRTCMPAEIH